MKIIVTGANGFIGSHLCKILKDKGEKVYAMVRKTSDLSLLKDLNPKLEGVTLVYGDVTDMDSLKEALGNMDAVINLAGLVRGIDLQSFERVNVQGNINVCEACLEVNPIITRIIQLSSMAAAGPSELDEIKPEEAPYRELKGDLYGISKHNMEVALKPYFETLPQMCIVRPPIVLGAGDSASLDLYKTVKSGFKVVIGRKPRKYSIVDVRDLCKGIYVAVKSDSSNGETFYFCSEEPIEWGDLQEVIAREFFTRTKPLRALRIPPNIALAVGSINQGISKIRKKPAFLGKTKMVEAVAPSWCFSYTKAKNLLDYVPDHTIAECVKDAADWYIAHDML